MGINSEFSIKLLTQEVLESILEDEQVVLSSDLLRYSKEYPDSLNRRLFSQTSQSHDSFFACFVR